jgi:hypothetical protein
MRTAQSFGAGLWTGNELIVVWHWAHLLPDDVRQEAGAGIAELRGEVHARSECRSSNRPTTDRSPSRRQPAPWLHADR